MVEVDRSHWESLGGHRESLGAIGSQQQRVSVRVEYEQEPSGAIGSHRDHRESFEARE